MGLFPRAIPPGEDGKLVKLVMLRLILSTLVIGAAILMLQMHTRIRSITAFYNLLGVFYLATGLAYLAWRKGAKLASTVCALIGFDLVILTLIVHYSGGSLSYFTILFVFPIIIAGDYFHVAGGLTTAVMATSIYFTYTLLEIGGYISTPFSGLIHPSAAEVVSGPFLRGYLHMVLFVLSGLASGYVSRFIKSKGDELADKEMELKRIRLDTDGILMNMSSGLVVIDMDGVILSLNPAALSILRLDENAEYKGMPVDKAFAHISDLASELEFVLESGMTRKRHEIEIVDSEGSALPLGISISILRTETGESRGVIAIFQDLTEVNQMREKIRQSDRMAAVGELSAAIAHEVRAPLASICGSIDMLKGEFELSGDNAELMDLIIRESERLDRIISDFLEYARLRKPVFTHTDIEKCLSDTAILLRHSANIESSDTIDLSLDGSGQVIRADGEQVRQVFLNLGLNACEMIGKDGKLSITLKKVMAKMSETGPEEECVQIDFHNDGPVIPDHVLPRIFEPFFTTKEGGTGLGLAIAARIIESHSGMIRVGSTREDGTVFSVILPVYTSCTDEEEIYEEELSSI